MQYTSGKCVQVQQGQQPFLTGQGVMHGMSEVRLKCCMHASIGLHCGKLPQSRYILSCHAEFKSCTFATFLQRAAPKRPSKPSMMSTLSAKAVNSSRSADVADVDRKSAAPVCMMLQHVDKLHKAQPFQNVRFNCVVAEVVEQRLQVCLERLTPAQWHQAWHHALIA